MKIKSQISKFLFPLVVLLFFLVIYLYMFVCLLFLRQLLFAFCWLLVFVNFVHELSNSGILRDEISYHYVIAISATFNAANADDVKPNQTKRMKKPTHKC